jgi:hypothetical protein
MIQALFSLFSPINPETISRNAGESAKQHSIRNILDHRLPVSLRDFARPRYRSPLKD